MLALTERGALLRVASLQVILAVAILIAGAAVSANTLSLPSFRPDVSELPPPGPELESLISRLERAVAREETDPQLRALLGTCYRRRGTIEGRYRAVLALKQAIDLDPREPGYRLALGLTRVEQGFESYARGEFEEVVTLAPSCTLAHLELGLSYFREWRELRRDPELLEPCTAALAASFELEPSADAGFQLALALAGGGDKKGAREVADSLVVARPWSARAHMLQGLFAYEDRDRRRAAEAWELALTLLPPEERAAYEDISPLVPWPEKRQYREGSFSLRREKERIFWQERDPTPTTRINDRQLEHYCRVLLADAYFSLPRLGLPGWETERGRNYIRYGEPQARHYVPGYVLPGNYSPPRVIWTYELEGAVFELAFDDRGLNGNYSIPIETRPGTWAEQAVLVELTFPELTQYSYPGVDLPLSVEACRFRGPEGKVQLSLYYQLPARRVPWRASGRFWELRAEKRLTVFDSSWREVLRTASPVGYRGGPSLAAARDEIHLDLATAELEPGTYQVALALEEERQEARLLWQETVSLESLGSTPLQLSDILFAREVTPAESSGTFTRHGLDVIPRMGAAFPTREDILFYYEIYGLEPVGEGVSLYEVQYRVELLSPSREEGFFLGRWLRRLRGIVGRPAVSYRFQRKGRGETAAEHLTLDGSTFSPGRYRLTIGVEDLVGEREASRETEFTIGGPGP